MSRFAHTPSWRQVLLSMCCAAVLGVGGAAPAAAPASAPAASERSAADPQTAEPGAPSHALADEASDAYQNVTSGLCIGVNNASVEPGAYLQQFPCDGTSNQTWIRTLDPKTNTYELKNDKSQLCMGVDQASTQPKADLRQFPCDHSAHQQWKIEANDPHGLRFRNHKSRLCIGVNHASVNPKAQLIQFPCDGVPNQGWIPCSMTGDC
jgi:hypothetical protein